MLFSVPVSIMISFFFLGIEELSIQLEEPFSILPLHNITEGIGESAEEHFEWNEKDSRGPEMHQAIPMQYTQQYVPQQQMAAQPPLVSAVGSVHDEATAIPPQVYEEQPQQPNQAPDQPSQASSGDGYASLADALRAMTSEK